jgi:hypothetical protein
VAMSDLTISAEAMAGTGMRIRWSNQSAFERKPVPHLMRGGTGSQEKKHQNRK